MTRSVIPAISGDAADRDSVIRYSTSRVPAKRTGSKHGSRASRGGVTHAMICGSCRHRAAVLAVW